MRYEFGAVTFKSVIYIDQKSTARSTNDLQRSSFSNVGGLFVLAGVSRG